MTTGYNAYRIIPKKSDLTSGMHYVACPLCGQDQTETVLTSR